MPLQEIKETRKVMIDFRAKKHNDSTLQSLEEFVINERNLDDFVPLNESNAL